MFWNDLKQKGIILGLSPMDGVTDGPMRYMTAKYGSEPNGVNVLFTEFVSVDGLHHARGENKQKILKAFVRAKDVVLDRQSSEPCLSRWPCEVAQIFGRTPEYFAEAARLIEQLGFDGVDINMGCPAKNVSEHGGGAGLIRTPELAQNIVKATKVATKLPVSVKTRIGVLDKSEMEEWIEAIVEVAPAVLSLHGRTLKQMYTGEADWEAIGRAAEIVHRHGGLILGNGDIKSMDDAHSKIEKYGVDGVLLGRASFGNPGVFVGMDDPSVEQRLAWMREHVSIYEQVFGEGYFLPVRKHLAWYAKGFPGASELRQQLVRTNSAEEVDNILGEYTDR